MVSIPCDNLYCCRICAIRDENEAVIKPSTFDAKPDCEYLDQCFSRHKDFDQISCQYFSMNVFDSGGIDSTFTDFLFSHFLRCNSEH